MNNCTDQTLTRTLSRTRHRRGGQFPSPLPRRLGGADYARRPCRVRQRIKVRGIVVSLLLAVSAGAQPTNTFTVTSYNVENWLSMERGGVAGVPKPLAQREAAVDTLATIRPDVLGLMEIGTTNDLTDLTDRLRARGMEFPYREWIQGFDTDRHVALLSRFPIAERHSRTDYTYTLGTKPMTMSRGILDVLLQVNPQYSFRVLVVHLKSKREVDYGDQARMRLEEARLLRQHIEAILQKHSRQNLLLIGDHNDTPETETMRPAVGTAPFQLFDLNPVDSRGYHDTHYWMARRQYSRIDYLLASPGMSNEYVAGSAHLVETNLWRRAGDHRPIFAQFYAYDMGEQLERPKALKAYRRPLWVLVAVAGAAVVIAIAAVAIVRQKRLNL